MGANLQLFYLHPSNLVQSDSSHLVSLQAGQGYYILIHILLAARF